VDKKAVEEAMRFAMDADFEMEAKRRGYIKVPAVVSQEAPSTKAPAPVDAFREPVSVDDARQLARLRGEIDYPEEAPASGREGGEGSGPSAKTLRDAKRVEEPGEFAWEPHARALRDVMEREGIEVVCLGPRWEAKFHDLYDPEGKDSE
jgi:hypothetical protein